MQCCDAELLNRKRSMDPDLRMPSCESEFRRFNRTLANIEQLVQQLVTGAEHSAHPPTASIPAPCDMSIHQRTTAEPSCIVPQHANYVPSAAQLTSALTSGSSVPAHVSHHAVAPAPLAELEARPHLRVLTLGGHTHAIDLGKLQLPPRRPYNANPQMLVHDWDHAPFHWRADADALLNVGVKDWPAIYKGTSHWKRLKDDFSRFKVCTPPLFFPTSGVPSPTISCSTLYRSGVASNLNRHSGIPIRMQTVPGCPSKQSHRSSWQHASAGMSHMLLLREQSMAAISRAIAGSHM